jgi:hypothetical protein
MGLAGLVAVVCNPVLPGNWICLKWRWFIMQSSRLAIMSRDAESPGPIPIRADRRGRVAARLWVTIASSFFHPRQAVLALVRRR